MARPKRITAAEHRNILHWWIHGHSTRAISALLRERGVSVSHVAVWKYIWRFLDVKGDPGLAGVLVRGRLGQRWGRRLQLPDGSGPTAGNEILFTFNGEILGENSDFMHNSVNFGLAADAA